MFEVVGKLVLELLVPNARPSRPITQRIARLDHELGDHTMENHIVVIPAARKPDEVLHGLGRLLGEEPHVDVAHRRVDRRGVRDGGGA